MRFQTELNLINNDNNDETQKHKTGDSITDKS